MIPLTNHDFQWGCYNLPSEARGLTMLTIDPPFLQSIDPQETTTNPILLISGK